jgi:hypothetical protein
MNSNDFVFYIIPPPADKPKQMTSPSDILLLRTRLIALISCIDHLSIHSDTLEKYVRFFHIETLADIQSAMMGLHLEGVITDTVRLLDIGTTIDELEYSNNPLAYQIIYKLLEKTLKAYRLMKIHLKDATQKLINAYDLDAEQIMGWVEVVGLPESETSKQTRYAAHVNDSSWNLLKLAELGERVFDLCDYMHRKHICCIPAMPVSGERDFGDWYPYLKVGGFLHLHGCFSKEDFCVEMTSAVMIMESIECEIEDMLDGIRAWKILQCAMALHRRVGAESWLGSLGQDLVKMIAKRVLE